MTRPAATLRNRAVAKGSSLDTLKPQALNSDMVNGRLRIRAELSQACFGGGYKPSGKLHWWTRPLGSSVCLQT